MNNILDLNGTIDALFQQLADWTAMSSLNTKGKLVAKNSSNLGIHFCVNLSTDNYGYESNGNTFHEEWVRHYSTYIHIIILSSRSVFVAESDQVNLMSVPTSCFKNTSNHDSCYRSDGFGILDKKYFEAYEYCWSHVPDEHKKAPIACSIGTNLSPMLKKPFRYVRVKHIPISTRDTYWRRLIEIREVNYSIVIED